MAKEPLGRWVIKTISLMTFNEPSLGKHMSGVTCGYIFWLYISAQRKHKSSETVVKQRKCFKISPIKRKFNWNGIFKPFQNRAKSLLLLSVVFVVCSFVLTFCFYLISTSPTSFTKRIRPQCHNNNSHNRQHREEEASVVVVTFVEITSATSALLHCGNSFFQSPDFDVRCTPPQPMELDRRSCGHFTCLI